MKDQVAYGGYNWLGIPPGNTTYRICLHTPQFRMAPSAIFPNSQHTELINPQSTPKSHHQPLHPVLQEFQDLIESDASLFILFHQMFSEVPTHPPYNNDPTGAPQVRSYTDMLSRFNQILTTAPVFEPDSGLVGFPINAILNWPMGTASGAAVFLNPKVNAQLKKILDLWGQFLASPESAHVLNTGWCGTCGEEEIEFSRTFVCDPKKPNYGFMSWDGFFTREFREGVRPVENAEDDRFIANPCEAAPYAIQTNVASTDQFWLKGQRYSITHMLENDPLSPVFFGGTVYQAYLSATAYHRWHSPVVGTVVKQYVIPGTYYSAARSAGFDPISPGASQGYLTQVATRAVVFIEADNPDIGLMCFMAVGMAEASTCAVGVVAGQRVRKGDELGTFHFGGSTQCLLFNKSVVLEFLVGETLGDAADVVQVKRSIAAVVGKKNGA